MPYDASLENVIQSAGVRRCLECGKCTAICPVARFDGGFSPRVTVGRALLGQGDELLRDRVWTCLSCFQCSETCPANIDYSAVALALRVEAHRQGQAALCTHGEAIHVWMRMMTDPDLRQNRLEWLTPISDGKFHVVDSALQSEKAVASTRPASIDTMYFAGCAPHYDVLFAPLGVAGAEVAQSSIRVLNTLGIEPLVLSNERCCGHDLLWDGDVDRFLQLARLNADMIRAAGVNRIVSSCPECVRALRVDYPAHGVQLNARVLHLSELIAECGIDRHSATSNLQHPTSNAQSLISNLRAVTFHDPCRLGRHLGVYDAPRQVLRQLGYQLVEMRHSRRNATCCGTNGWTHCGAANKAIQIQRLREAKATGADAIVTACLKCQIHFKCALMDKQLQDEIGIPMVDLATLVAARLS